MVTRERDTGAEGKDEREFLDRVSAELCSAVLSDVLDDLGYRAQALPWEIRSLGRLSRMAGRAATLEVVETDVLPATPYQTLMALLDALVPGEVVVCAAHASTRSAYWGDLLSTCAVSRGARGVVIDGLCRDSERIRETALAVFARGTAPTDSKGRLEAVGLRGRVEVGAVQIDDGDLIVADTDGCVAVPRAIESEVIDRARRKLRGEDDVRRRLRAGESIVKVFSEEGVL